MPRLIDLTGKRFDRLVVLSRADTDVHGNIWWNCVCDCGKRTMAPGNNLKHRNNRSCGCLWIEKVTTHGLSKTSTYRGWVGMLQRCQNPSDPRYKRYGARGITVCDRWHKFEHFLADMGQRPDGLSIDRIDNDGNYEPGNCRWADQTTQNRNKSSNTILTHAGKSQCVAAWASETGFSHQAILWRINAGWPVDQALTRPLHSPYRPDKQDV